MTRITLLLMALASFALGQSSKPTLPPLPALISQDEFKALNLKVDSLSFELKEAEIAATYANKTLEATANSNSLLIYSFLGFISGIVTLVIAGFAFVNILMNKRAEREQDFIGTQVRESVQDYFDQEFKRIDGQGKEISGELGTLQRNYALFAGEVDTRIRNIESLNLNETLNKFNSSIQNNELGSVIRNLNQILTIARNIEVDNDYKKSLYMHNEFLKSIPKDSKLEKLELQENGFQMALSTVKSIIADPKQEFTQDLISTVESLFEFLEPAQVGQIKDLINPYKFKQSGGKYGFPAQS